MKGNREKEKEKEKNSRPKPYMYLYLRDPHASASLCHTELPHEHELVAPATQPPYNALVRTRLLAINPTPATANVTAVR